MLTEMEKISVLVGAANDLIENTPENAAAKGLLEKALQLLSIEPETQSDSQAREKEMSKEITQEQEEPAFYEKYKQTSIKLALFFNKEKMTNYEMIDTFIWFLRDIDLRSSRNNSPLWVAYAKERLDQTYEAVKEERQERSKEKENEKTIY